MEQFLNIYGYIYEKSLDAGTLRFLAFKNEKRHHIQRSYIYLTTFDLFHQLSSISTRKF